MSVREDLERLSREFRALVMEKAGLPLTDSEIIEFVRDRYIS